ncbi:hypothetical protein AB0L06_17335 [Spirillospora sp. NPDC052269]
MGHGVNPEDVTLAELRSTFNGHRIWRSTRHDGRLGDWGATLHDPDAGIDPTVICSSADELQQALVVEQLRARHKDR